MPISVFLKYIINTSFLLFNFKFSPSPQILLIFFLFPSFAFPLFTSSADLPSATRQRWWRTHWTQCGRPLKSLFELFATVITTGKSDSYFRYFRVQHPWQPLESSRGVILVIRNTENVMLGNMGNSDDRMDVPCKYLMASSGFLAHNIILQNVPYISWKNSQKYYCMQELLGTETCSMQLLPTLVLYKSFVFVWVKTQGHIHMKIYAR